MASDPVLLATMLYVPILICCHSLVSCRMSETDSMVVVECWTGFQEIWALFLTLLQVSPVGLKFNDM